MSHRGKHKNVGGRKGSGVQCALMREGSRTGVTRNSPDDFLTEGNAVCLFVCKLFGLFSETIASCPPTQNTVMVMIPAVV